MTQPSDPRPAAAGDPRKVKVIVELIDHTSTIAATYDRARSGGAPEVGQGAHQ